MCEANIYVNQTKKKDKQASRVVQTLKDLVYLVNKNQIRKIYDVRYELEFEIRRSRNLAQIFPRTKKT